MQPPDLSSDRPAEEWLRRAAAAEAAGDLEQALGSYAQAARRAPDDAGVHVSVAKLHLGAHRVPAAAAAFRHALALCPADGEALTGLGLCSYAGRALSGAVTGFGRAHATMPGSVAILTNLALALHEAGRLAEACHAYASLLGRAPDALPARHNQAAALLASGEFEAAARAFATLIDRHPDYEPGYSALAAIQAGHLGDLDAAAAVIEAARRHGIASPSLLQATACLARARGLRQSAAARQAEPPSLDRPTMPPRTLWLLILGQSNAANCGDLPVPAGPEVAVLRSGTLIPAIDPLPGSSGWGGSIWTRAADQLVKAGRAERVVLLPAARGGTRVIDWVGSLEAAVRPFGAAVRRIDRVLWQQGESDTSAGTTESAYADAMLAIEAGLRRLGIDAPIHVAVTSYNAGGTSSAIVAAQRALPKLGRSFRPGPELDDLASSHRYDDVHFNASGQDIAATRWVDALR